MPTYELNEIVAKRELVLCTPDGNETPAHASIGRPYFSKEHDAWQCPYEVAVGTSKKTFAVYGIDSLQALVLTLKIVDVELEVRSKQNNGTLLWHGEPHVTVLDPVDHLRK